MQTSFLEVATYGTALGNGQGLPFGGTGGKDQLCPIPIGHAPKNLSTAGAAPFTPPGASAKAEPSGGVRQLLRRVLPEKPGTEPAETTTCPPTGDCGAGRCGTYEGEFLMPRRPIPELSPVPPPSFFGEARPAHSNHLEFADAQKGDIIGLGEELCSVLHKFFQLLEGLPTFFDGGEGPPLAGPANGPKASPFRIVGHAIGGREVFQFLVRWERRMTDQTMGVQKRLRDPGREERRPGLPSTPGIPLFVTDRAKRFFGVSRSGLSYQREPPLGMLLVIDNYDSFTFNLVQFLGELGADVAVSRNDERTVEEIRALGPSRVVVSPGPCTPSEAGVSVELFRSLDPSIPMLGVCLGHQALGEAFGGRTIRAERVMHGKTALARHNGEGIFRGIPSPFTVARYHSLVTDAAALPDSLIPVAWSGEEDGIEEIQAIRHRDRPVWGVQFHPESLFSEHGKTLLANFLAL